MREIDTCHLAPGSRGSQKKEEMDKANQKRARGGIAKEMTKKKRKTEGCSYRGALRIRKYRRYLRTLYL